MATLAQRITIDPAQCGGRPCVRGMRIRVSDVLDLLANGLIPQQVLEELPDLEPEDIQACLQFASRRLDHPVIAAIVLLLDNKGRAIASGLAFLASTYAAAILLSRAKRPCVYRSDNGDMALFSCSGSMFGDLGYVDYIIIAVVGFIAMASVWSVTGKYWPRRSKAG